MAKDDPIARLTGRNLQHLARICDRLGGQANAQQIAAMAANKQTYDEDMRKVMVAVYRHFLEWLEPRWQSTGLSRGDMIRHMLGLQAQGLLDEDFNPTDEGRREVHSARQEENDP